MRIPAVESIKLAPVNKLIYIAFFLFLNFAFAGTAVRDSLVVEIDSRPVMEKSFSEDLPKKYTGSDFDYDAAEGDAQNYLGRVINWFFNKLGELFGVELSPAIHDIIELLVYLLLTIFIGYFIIKLLMGTNTSSLFNRKIASVVLLTSKEEHIESINLDQFIEDALANKDYRLAIRFMYLKCLKELSIYNFISWHFDKTNLDYFSEIQDPQLKANFKKVSYVYDYVWYGEFAIGEKEFISAKKDFDRLTPYFKNAG
jgi:hypothetical protein